MVETSTYTRLRAEAAKHAMSCNTCERHAMGHEYFKHLNPANLKAHLRYAHGYNGKRWWQFWK